MKALVLSTLNCHSMPVAAIGAHAAISKLYERISLFDVFG
jgi:hypothetical protein